MNIAVRKLKLLEKVIEGDAEATRIKGYSESPIDKDLKRNVAAILLKVRSI